MKFALFLSIPFLLFGAEYDKRVVFSCKSGDMKLFEKTLDSMQHLVDHYEKFKMSYDIVTVAQAECVRFMLKDFDGTEYRGLEIPIDIEFKMEKLKGKARFEECRNTLERKKISESKLKKEVKVVPSATLTLVDYQLKGYAFLPQ